MPERLEGNEIVVRPSASRERDVAPCPMVAALQMTKTWRRLLGPAQQAPLIRQLHKVDQVH
jgi:hypothetical protein